MKNCEIKIMSLNLLTDLFVSSDNPHFSKRINSIESLIEQYDPDIICTQELTNRMIPYLNHILETYTMVGEFRKSPATDEMTGILFKKDKYKLIDTKTFWLSNTPNKKYSKFLFSQLPRIATYAYLKDKETNKTFYVFNAHLDHLFDFVRKKQLNVVLKLMKKTRSDNFTILCGDFNCTSNTLHPITQSTLVDLIPDSVGSTLRGKIGTKRYHNKPIDHIFVCKDQEVSYTSLKLIDSYNGIYPTDHYPVLSTIEIK